MTKFFKLSAFIVFPILLSLCPSSVFAKTIQSQSKISSVTIFPDRALVIRQAEITLPAGEYEIELSNLPASIEEDSINAKGLGSAKMKLYGAKLVSHQLDEPQSDRARQIKTEIERLKDRQQELADRENILNEKKDFLTSIKAASSEQIGKDLVTKQPSTSDATEVLGLLDKEMTTINQESAKFRVEIRDIVEQIDRLNRELKEVSWNTVKADKSIIVDIEVMEEGTFSIEVSYRLSGATWEPVYEARRNSNSTDIQFLSYAVIKQNTGEAWEDASLKVSTAKPAVSGELPEITPWYLAKEEPIIYAKAQMLGISSELRRDAMMSAPAAMEAGSVQNYVAETPQASIDNSGPAVSFTLPKKETVYSDWQPKKSLINSQTMKAEIAYEVTPRLSPFAYLRAKVKNTSEALLLAGKVQIFVDDSFIGSSNIENIGTEETFDLSMGIDEQIKVERRQLKAKEDVSVIPGLHGKIKSIDYNYVTKIENHRGDASKVFVFDQVPISQNDEIKVEQIFLDPKPAESIEDKPGVSKWEFNVTS